MNFPINRTLLTLCVATSLVAQTAFAECTDIQGSGNISIISSAMPSALHIAKVIEQCNNGKIKASVKIVPDDSSEVELAFASNGKSVFDAAIMSSEVYSSLAAKGQLQPMTDLVSKYRDTYHIEDGMLVKTGGKVLAIAFQQNAQNLFYRKDLFDKYNIKVPTTYQEMLQAAATIKAKDPSIPYPIAQTFSKGWDISTEFVNLYEGFGGKLFQPGSAAPAFNGPAGVKTIELMKSMLPYMTPNYLASNSDDVMNQFQQGKAAMGVLWASRAQRMDDPAASKVVGKMAFAAAPAVMPGGKSATHLWWDGVALPANMSANRDTVFQVLMNALDENNTKAGNDATIWVRSVYKPTRFGTGVLMSMKAGAPIWPTEPYLGLATGALGRFIPDALAGTSSPQQALDAAAAAYKEAAAEKGYLK
ncbi:ABC transporter substrate-binding protein [Caballeronia sp. J97]|uniref:ABC transporter substrate-binding protein n=1 Tax=Caballeronia sp. J97 TaxID=2805429 RepID=UPI002AB233E7|nr:extracellular solute-binding protein [Caballeronia sp. J97]